MLKKIKLIAAIFIALVLPTQAYSKTTINDVSKLTTTQISKVLKPKTVQELRKIVVSTKEPISVAGGRFSQGGQICFPNGLVVDMTELNGITQFDKANKKITVQAGARWSALQEFIDPYNLSIYVMQSYNDFTVGGSLSVNVHGRNLDRGQLIETVESIKVLLADGSFVKASRTENCDLFVAAVGGYGAFGIITEATLVLTENTKIIRTFERLRPEEFQKYFFENIYNNPTVSLYNANLYPNDFNEILSIAWYRTDEKLTTSERLQKKKIIYLKDMILEQLLRRITYIKIFRPHFDAKNLQEHAVIMRNYEMSYSTAMLEPLARFPTTTVLQEYFVPCDRFNSFIDLMRETVKKHGVNVLNVSIRYVPKNTESLLSYAQQDSFALVFYINMLNTKGGQEAAQLWTQELIEHALSVQGTYYLPYQCYATKEQFRRAYPNFAQFRELKQKYDPKNIFINTFLDKYLS